MRKHYASFPTAASKEGSCNYAFELPSVRSMSVESAAATELLLDRSNQHNMSPQQCLGNYRPPRRIRRCASTPTLSTAASVSSGTCQTGLDVFVISRPFTEFGGALFARLPPGVKDNFVNLGIAHYMTVFRTADGRLHQFDFGPMGGRDIYVSSGAFDKMVQPDQPRAKGKRSVAGEVRENQLLALPQSFVYVGKSHLSLRDIRNFNTIQQTHYELHKNDCRHYVNNLVRYTTGVERASAVFVQQAYRQQHMNQRWLNPFFTIGHCLTDVANWPKVKAVSQATVAAAALLSGKYTFARVQPALPCLAAQRTSLAIVPAVRHRMARRPVYVAATGAVATCAATFKQNVPVQEACSISNRFGDGLRSLALSAAAFGRQTAGGLQSTMALAGNAAAGAAACAGAATRGAASTMQHRHHLVAQASPAQRLVLPLARLRRQRQTQALVTV